MLGFQAFVLQGVRLGPRFGLCRRSMGRLRSQFSGAALVHAQRGLQGRQSCLGLGRAGRGAACLIEVLAQTRDLALGFVDPWHQRLQALLDLDQALVRVSLLSADGPSFAVEPLVPSRGLASRGVGAVVRTRRVGAARLGVEQSRVRATQGRGCGRRGRFQLRLPLSCLAQRPLHGGESPADIPVRRVVNAQPNGSVDVDGVAVQGDDLIGGEVGTVLAHA